MGLSYLLAYYNNLVGLPQNSTFNESLNFQLKTNSIREILMGKSSILQIWTYVQIDSANISWAVTVPNTCGYLYTAMALEICDGIVRTLALNHRVHMQIHILPHNAIVVDPRTIQE